MYYVADDTAAPVTLRTKPMNDLPAYEDEYSTKNTKEIKEARTDLEKIQKLLDESFTREELLSLIATTEKRSTTISGPSGRRRSRWIRRKRNWATAPYTAR